MLTLVLLSPTGNGGIEVTWPWCIVDAKSC
jgi:hypothetical protein